MCLVISVLRGEKGDKRDCPFKRKSRLGVLYGERFYSQERREFFTPAFYESYICHICSYAAKNSSCVCILKTPPWKKERAAILCIKSEKVAAVYLALKRHFGPLPANSRTLTYILFVRTYIYILWIFWNVKTTPSLYLGVLIEIGILSFVSSHLNSWDIFFNCVGHLCVPLKRNTKRERPYLCIES